MVLDAENIKNKDKDDNMKRSYIISNFLYQGTLAGRDGCVD